MSDLWVCRVDNCLVPYDEESQAIFEKMPVGRQLHCTVKQPRSASHLRLYWAITHRIANALDRPDIDHETVDKFFKRSVGLYKTVESKSYGEIIEYGSISFAKMDQQAFREFFEKCIRFAYLEWGIPADVFSDLLEDKR